MSEKAQVIPISLGMVNAFALKGTRTVLVDTGYIGSEAKILQALEKNGVQPNEISLIVITHAHTDHFGSVPALKQKTGAKVAISAEDAPYLHSGVNPPLYAATTAGKFMQFVGDHIKQPPLPGMEPDILINGEMDLAPYGVEGKIVSTSGHTPGSCSVLLAGGEMLVGDLISGKWLNPKSPQHSLFCKDAAQRDQSIQKVIGLKPTIIYAGHGGPFTLESVQKAFK